MIAAAAFALLGSAAVIVGKAVAIAWRDLHPPRDHVEPALGARAGLQDVSFTTADGLTLRGWYRAPTNGAVVLLAHGHGGSRRQVLPQADALTRHGFGVLLFDFRAHGESDGRVATSGDLERLDLAAARAFVGSRADSARARLGALGFSMGASVVAEVAATDPSIEAVVLEASPATLEEDIATDYTRWRPFAPFVGVVTHVVAGVRVREVRPIDRLCAISPRPVFLVYGERDPSFPSGTVGHRMLDAACDPKEFWIVPAAAHGGFMDASPGEYEARMVAFFSRALLAVGPVSKREAASVAR